MKFRSLIGSRLLRKRLPSQICIQLFELLISLMRHKFFKVFQVKKEPTLHAIDTKYMNRSEYIKSGINLTNICFYNKESVLNKCHKKNDVQFFGSSQALLGIWIISSSSLFLAVGHFIRLLRNFSLKGKRYVASHHQVVFCHIAPQKLVKNH